MDLGCMCLGQSQGRSRGHKGSKSRSRKGGEEKSLHQWSSQASLHKALSVLPAKRTATIPGLYFKVLIYF